MAKKKPEAPKKAPQTSPKPAPTREPKSESAQSYTWMGILAAVLGVALYINTLGHYYVLDDYSAIKENTITQRGLAGIGEIFTSEYRAGAWNSPGTLYRPLTLSMFALEWQLSPDKPFLSHLVNILLYGLTGWVLFVVWRRVLKNYSPLLAGMIALLFIAHPVHTEVVANIKSRDEILSLLFCSATLWFIWNYLDKERMISLITALLCFTAALFSKESSVTWLAVIPLAIWCFREVPLKRNLSLTALFILPFVLFMVARHNALSKQKGEEIFSVLDNFMVAQPQYSPKQLAGAFTMCFQYVKTLVFPLHLVSDRGYPQFDLNNLPTGQSAIGIILFFGAGFWALWRLRQKQVLAFAVLLFLATFSLFSNVFIAIGTSYGERLLYLPSLGFVIGVAYLLYQWHQSGVLSKSALYGVLGLILFLFSLRTFTRNPDWKTSYALYQADYPKSPRCAKLNYHLGIEQAKEALDSAEAVVVKPGWLDTCINSYNRALQLYPDYHDCFSSRGLAYFRKQMYNEAFEDYQKALKYRPDDSKVLSNMGFIYFLRNDLATAETIYTKSIALDPKFVDAHRNLGVVYAKTNRFPQAIKQWEEALKYAPRSAILWYYIGSANKDMGQGEKGIPFFEKAISFEPRMADAHRMLGEVYLSMNQIDKGIQKLEEAYRLAPQNALTLIALGNAYVRSGQQAKGAPLLEKAAAMQQGGK